MKIITIIFAVAFCVAWAVASEQPATPVHAFVQRATLVPMPEPTADTQPTSTPDFGGGHTAYPGPTTPTPNSYPAPPEAPRRTQPSIRDQIADAMGDLWRAITGQ